MRRYLPPRTAPPSVPQRRRHQPAPQADYHRYRDCARHDFGFTCAWCLLSLPDLRAAENPAVQSWGMQLDHVLPRKHHPQHATDYTNLVLACASCNRTKSDVDPMAPGAAPMLDPTRDVWAAHFSLRVDELAPQTPEGAETATRVGINHRLKRALRDARHHRITRLREQLAVNEASQHGERAALARLLLRPDLSPDERAALASAMKRLDAVNAPVLEELSRWQMPPATIEPCACAVAPELPPWLQAQTWCP